MKQTIEFKGFDDNSLEPKNVRRLIDELVQRLERRVKAFSPDATSLRVMVEKKSAAVHKLYEVSIHLDVPGKTLAAKQEMHELDAAIRKAFTEIERQLEDYKSDSRMEHLWKRLARREEVRHKKVPAVPADLPETFFAVVQPHLDRVNEFVRHVLESAEASGDVAPDELDPQDIVDTTVLEAYSEFVKNRTPGDIRGWLLRIASKQVDSVIRRSAREHQRTVHIDAESPEQPPRHDEEPNSDELVDFYLPEEDLNLEEVLPALEVPGPEQEEEQEEFRSCVRRAFAGMPRKLRRMLLLHYIQGLSVAELAKALDQPEAEIQRMIETGREHLRQQLTAAGCGFRQAVK